MAVKNYKINFKSDFVLTVQCDAGWNLPFCVKFWTGAPSQSYFAAFDGTEYRNCRMGDTSDKLVVLFDDHHLPIGELKMQIAYHTTIEEFPTVEYDEVTNAQKVTTVLDGEEYHVMLDFTGETAPEIQFALPAYYNEQERQRVFAEMQAENAQAVQEAENVNAQLDGTILTVTDRNGISTSSDVQGPEGPQGLRGEQGPKGDPSTADINLVGTVVTVTNNAGKKTSLDLEDAIEDAVYNVVVTQEVVQISVTVAADAPQGTTASGLVINAYYNDADVPSAQTTTDANGMAVLRVPAGYKYKLVFPSQQGCKPIPDVVHTASIPQRSVEVEYEEYVISDGEIVRVVVEQKTGDVLSRVAGVDIVVTYDGTATTYTTDATGTVQFIVPYGKQYTITAPHREDWYLHENRYTLNLTAEQTNRAVTFVYRSYESGLAIIAADGGEYTLEEWEAAVEAGTRQNSEAMLIKISTGQLAQNGGVFAIDIDMVRNRSQGTNVAWSSQNVAFNSVPLNGNSTSAAYYYDGLTASRLVQQEGDERSIDTLAADRCLAMSRVIGAGTGAELSLPGFLGSVGQWNELWKNVVEIDDILLSTRPEGQYLMSTWTTSKWTITQYGANSAWYWGPAASANGKVVSCVVLPFFAY